MRRLKKIKVPRMIKKPFTQAEMEHLRCNAECQRDIAIMAFLYSTAARIGEVVRLNRKDIDWGNKEVIIYGEKGKKERRVYLTDDCAYHLNRTGDDTSGRIWERTRRMGVNTLAFRLPQHNTFYHIDADCVGIFGMIPWEKNRQWADVLAKSGTPLFVSAKPGVLNPEEFEELHQIMLRASEQEEHFVPLDWEEIDCPEVWGENGETITYDWFDNEGPTMDAAVEYYNAKVVVP